MDGGGNDGAEGSVPGKRPDCQTAAEFIDDQLRLEADAREALPYAFDMCTRPLGALRQSLFSCLTCNPPPLSPSEPYNPAGICYACSISCHGEHTLAELFSKRNFACDCGTTRFSSTSPCGLRINPETGSKGGSHSEAPVASNRYNHNFQNRFCSCDQTYDPHQEKATMYQCLGLGTIEEGGCGEDWWHPSCLLGLPSDWHNDTDEHGDPVRNGCVEDDDPASPPGFPDEDSFDGFICWKCVKSHPWIKRYAGTTGFLPPVFRAAPDDMSETASNKSTDAANDDPPEKSGTAVSADTSKKRKVDEGEDSAVDGGRAKKSKSDVANGHGHPSATTSNTAATNGVVKCGYNQLPPPPDRNFSLFFTENFREKLCRCAVCFPKVGPHPQLVEEEETYEPRLSSESGNEDEHEADVGRSSAGTNSLLDMGERALSNVDRVRAIEGVMVYNDLKEKVKAFLTPFAETGQPVGAEDVKEYFAKLRGDAEDLKVANAAAVSARGSASRKGRDHRREQDGEPDCS